MVVAGDAVSSLLDCCCILRLDKGEIVNSRIREDENPVNIMLEISTLKTVVLKIHCNLVKHC